MDPVSAFSLAAGVVQVVDVSFRALSICREIYKNGSLVEHRDTTEITEHLKETTQHLENSFSNVPASAAKHSKDVIDISKKCSGVAAELLAELHKLQRDPRDGLRQSVRKSVLALRKTRFLAQTQDKLEKFREVLNTRILLKLDFHALQQIDTSNKLDQNVKDLAVALSEGRNTYEQLLATQTTVLQKHVDRRFNDKTHEEAVLSARQQFKDSLFYPEIFARQDDIARSHEGTCRWIFGPPQAGDEARSMTASSQGSIPAEPLEDCRAQPWSNFKHWLERKSSDPYWLSGKPGSGKSTLMKYVSTEFTKHCRLHETLSAWVDAITCSFFFWNLGSSLQKNYVGFVRSLLFQIAQQRPETIPIMCDQYTFRESSSIGSYGCVPIYVWTEQRLDNALKNFLTKKPSSMRVCMFFDGLDEFVGDEDRLFDTIRALSQTSATKVCVSSRPEQIFRQGFATCPQLRLQDLNYPDIHKATVEQLIPTLKAHVPCSETMLTSLAYQVIAKSQGIFLWADLMTKDLKRGAKNADSIEELRERLERTPETIDGLYEHMLSRLDKAYFPDAAKYFHHLLAFQEHAWSRILPPTLLGFACIEEGISSQQKHKNLAMIQSSNVLELCHRVETRILTRCAGLVEIDEEPRRIIPYIRVGNNEYEQMFLGEEDIACFIREVRFIHKSAADFLRKHEEYSQDSKWRLTGTLSAVRAQIAVARSTPQIISKPRPTAQGLIVVARPFLEDLMRASLPEDGCCQAIRDAAIRIVDETYDVLCYIHTTLNGTDCTISNSYSMFATCIDDVDCINPFQNRLGFAAYFGRCDYVACYTTCNNFSQADIEVVHGPRSARDRPRWSEVFKTFCWNVSLCPKIPVW